MLDKFMRNFAVWFGSPRGVVQTFIFTTIVGIAEQMFPNIDPQHFFYMYLMTYYSTVTQTVLAYASNISSDHSEEVLARIEHVQTKQIETGEIVVQLAKNQTDMMKALLAIAHRLEHNLGEIAEDVEDIREAHE